MSHDLKIFQEHGIDGSQDHIKRSPASAEQEVGGELEGTSTVKSRVNKCAHGLLVAQLSLVLNSSEHSS